MVVIMPGPGRADYSGPPGYKSCCRFLSPIEFASPSYHLTTHRNLPKMSLGKVITLNDGRTIPQIGLGTWLSEPNEVQNAVCPYLSLLSLTLDKRSAAMTGRNCCPSWIPPS